MEKGFSNLTRTAHSQFDILMGITQAHILSFGVVPGAGDTESIASSVRAPPPPLPSTRIYICKSSPYLHVPHGLERLFAEAESVETREGDHVAAAEPVAIPRVRSIEQQPSEAVSCSDLSSVASASAMENEDIPIFDDELELSEFLQRRCMEWTPVDSESSALRQSESGINDALQRPEALAGLVQGDVRAQQLASLCFCNTSNMY